MSWSDPIFTYELRYPNVIVISVETVQKSWILFPQYSTSHFRSYGLTGETTCNLALTMMPFQGNDSKHIRQQWKKSILKLCLVYDVN
jgi:hypothetical protein